MLKFHAPGKWVLAGEHAVLRGHPAVAIPAPEFQLQMTLHPASSGGIRLTSEQAPSGLLNDILGRYGQMLSGIHGELHISSNIPIGAGLGSSAAFSVTLSRLLCRCGDLPADRQLSLAREIEDFFHGKSSGMDVAVVNEESPILFEKGEVSRLNPALIPRFSLHDTGIRSRTREAIAQVSSLFQSSPELAQTTDIRMGDAAKKAAKALTGGDLDGLAESMREAQACFESWGLVPEPARKLIRSLEENGALAARLTGAGLGGFVVSLDGAAGLPL